VLEPSPAAKLIEAFANTVNLEYGTDALATPELLAVWLRETGLLDRSRAVDVTAHDACLRLRSGIREELGVNVGVTPSADVLAAADEVLLGLPVLLSVRGSAPGSAGWGRLLSPAPGLSPVEGALAHLAIVWGELRLTGEAERLKRCAEHTCELVFWDVSKNHSRRWCSMRVCGNRAKSRRYAARTAVRDPEDSP
jgi:predicted RNA-binding Zn ribbon-like protein